MRTSRKTITFRLPFRFPGLDARQPPGTYIVVTEEEEIPGLSFISWHRAETTLRLPAVSRDTGLEQVIAIIRKTWLRRWLETRKALPETLWFQHSNERKTIPMFIAPILAALVSGAAIFYLLRILQDSDRIAAERLKVTSESSGSAVHRLEI